MSYTIYKSFNIKNGKISCLAAESNLFDVTYDRRGRQHQKLIFSRESGDFRVNEPTRSVSVFGNELKEEVNNKWYGWTDLDIYTDWMLNSAFCGDKYYEAKHKLAVETIHREITKWQAEAIRKLCNALGITQEEWDAKDWKEQRELGEANGYNEYRYYTAPTVDERVELKLLMNSLDKAFQLRKRIISYVDKSGEPKYITKISSRDVKFSAYEPTKPTYFTIKDLIQLAKVVTQLGCGSADNVIIQESNGASTLSAVLEDYKSGLFAIPLE